MDIKQYGPVRHVCLWIATSGLMLSGCIVDSKPQTGQGSSAIGSTAALLGLPSGGNPPSPPPPMTCPCAPMPLLSEPWNTFDASKWSGDGDQLVAGGYFQAAPLASSAAADWIQPYPVPVDGRSSVVFTNRIQFTSTMENDFTESGALFYLNEDNDGTYQNYVFMNIGYTLAPSHVFVELFGSSGGVDFDQFEETALAYSSSQSFDVTLSIDPHSYRVSAGGQAVDTVNLGTALTSLKTFEVGVQDQLGGLRGAIDQTTISKVCLGGSPEPPRDHPSCKGLQDLRIGPLCKNRNRFILAAKAAILLCPHPSQGLRALASLNLSL